MYERTVCAAVAQQSVQTAKRGAVRRCLWAPCETTQFPAAELTQAHELAACMQPRPSALSELLVHATKQLLQPARLDKTG